MTWIQLLRGLSNIMRNRKVLNLILLFAIAVSLLSALPITVNVVGYVRQPGVVIMDNNNRVSDAIFMVNQLPNASLISERDNELYTDQDMEKLLDAQEEEVMATIQNEEEAPQAYSKTIIDQKVLNFDNLPSKMSLRRIKLTRASGEETLDLMRYFRLGETEQNPYLMDGDVIFVPCKEMEVSLNGSWNQVQKLELLPGDRLSTIAALGLGLSLDADPNRSFIYRFTEDMTARETLPVNLVDAINNPGSSSDIEIKHGDEIYAFKRPNYVGREYITIEGLVKYPGKYPINGGLISLLDVLELCGGPSERGDMKLAYVLDPNLNTIEDEDYLRLKRMSTGSMTDAEYGYYILRLREMKGKYSVDLNKLWETKDEAYNTYIKPGTYIYVPEKMDKVIVSGHVKNPGLYDFEEGLTWKEWVEKAGGKIRNSKLRRSRIVDARTGQWIKPKKDTVVHAGDMVFVPQAQERSLWSDTQKVIAFTSQIITIFLGINSLTTQ